VPSEIQRLHREGRPLTAKRVKLYARSLFMAAARPFGSWGRALKPAGLDPTDHREPHKWSLVRARTWIEERLAAARPITHTHVPLGLVGCVAREARTGWGGFVEFTGRAYPGPIRHGWSRAIVLDHIRDRRRGGLPLSHKAPLDDDGRLLHQAQQRFVAWDRALLAAGIDPATVRLVRRCSKESLLAEVHARHCESAPQHTSNLCRPLLHGFND